MELRTYMPLWALFDERQYRKLLPVEHLEEYFAWQIFLSNWGDYEVEQDLYNPSFL